MNYIFYLKTMDRPAAMERVLRVIRHRRFEMRSLNMRPTSDKLGLEIRVIVSGDRPIEHLRNQLMKLNDVLWIKMAQNRPYPVVVEPCARVAADGGRNITKDPMPPLKRSIPSYRRRRASGHRSDPCGDPL